VLGSQLSAVHGLLSLHCQFAKHGSALARPHTMQASAMQASRVPTPNKYIGWAFGKEIGLRSGMRAIWLGAAALRGPGSSSSLPDAVSVMPDSSPPARTIVYVSGTGPDIVSYELDPMTGTLTQLGRTTAFAATPSFLAFAPDGGHLYAVSEATNRVAAYAID